jgi:tripartite-type tricarboxylate transporter receptor subunit TctC
VSARGLLLGVALVVAATGALAQSDYPSKPIRVLVPYAPGGTDQQIRALAPTLQKLLGQPLVVENREGGGATIGTNAVKMAAADGYTLLYTGTGAFTVATHMRKGVPYTLDDFVPIGNVTGTSFIVAARPDAPFKTYAELIAFAKANPGKVNFGSAGLGTTTHMTGEALQSAAGVQFTHVPFQGIGPAVRALIGSQIDIAIGLPSAIIPQVNGGKAIALASTGTARSEFAPNAPTLREGGHDVVEITKFGLFAARGTPEPVIAKLTAALAESVRAPEFVELAKRTFNTIYYLGPADYRPALDAESRYFRKLIGDLKLADGN